MDIKEKVAIITGGVGVLGLAASETILDKGGKVCLADCDTDKGREIEASLRTRYGSDRVLFVQCDVTVEEDIKRVFESAEKHLGVVEILCNNVGLNGEFPPDLLVKTNFTSVCHGTNVGIERMRKDRGGRGGVIINTASSLGVDPKWFLPTYSATKSAVYTYTRACSMNPNVDEIGIRFNCLCPSVFEAADSEPVPKKVVGKVLDIPAFLSFKDRYGCLTADRVAEGLCRLITEDRNGDALFMSKNLGTRFVALRLVDVPESI